MNLLAKDANLISLLGKWNFHTCFLHSESMPFICQRCYELGSPNQPIVDGFEDWCVECYENFGDYHG
ncbi:MAG TPA: hypothetical protein DDW56_04515 [Cyanobacteria bacterium UBA11366]|nr:hypothetical protein [Cyanobacteria bacterium UBA11366]HCA94641.1 hypothetical protein [Cyanobacteria bacterium UBA9226]